MRVVIAEDSVLLREGLTHILARFDVTVVAAVSNAPALLAGVAEHTPDLAIVDVRLPPGFRDEGLRAALEIRRNHPQVAVLVLSQYVEHTLAAELLSASAGRIGYLLKDRVGDVLEFIDALERVVDGATVIDPDVVRQLLDRGRQRTPLEGLTTREREVLALMAEGRSNPGIARALVVTEATVAKHITNIFIKLGLVPGDDEHRRVRAVLTYLQQVSSTGAGQ